METTISPALDDMYLVGVAITILKNMSSAMGRIIPYMKWKTKTCSKPPARQFLLRMICTYKC
jgi:hypothetical protein